MIESQAIKQLKDILGECTESNEAVCYVTNVDAPVLKIAINALEKQIPKKIAKYDVCPVCNNNQSTTWYYVGSSYCEICGQKLDWSDEE